MADITIPEVIPDQAGWDLTRVLIDKDTKEIRTWYKRVDAGGEVIANSGQVVTKLRNEPSEFNDLIIAINAGSDIEASVNQAVKDHYGY